MHTRLMVLMILLMALLLVACDGAPAAQQASSGQAPAQATTPGAGTPLPGVGGPRANRTPAANPQSALTPGAQRAPQSASTSAPNSTPTPAATTNSAAPTAVPIPQIIIPTPLPDVSASNNNSPSTTTNSPVVPATQTNAQPLPTSAPAASLESLRGKIVFFSDHDSLYPRLWVMNADGSDQQLCNCSDLLQTLVTNDVSSPDKQQALFVKQVSGGTRGGGDSQIWTHNSETNEDKAVTGGPPGFPTVDYDPAWSPDSRHIAWVTEANGYDEIYLYDRTTNENVRLTRSRGEWYKHPSFSPDGSQIVYWTNRDDANRKQIWVMRSDGSKQINISQSQSNDWDPIWVR